LKEILERQLIIYPMWVYCNIFCNCESSRGAHAAAGSNVVQAWCSESVKSDIKWVDKRVENRVAASCKKAYW